MEPSAFSLIVSSNPNDLFESQIDNFNLYNNVPNSNGNYLTNLEIMGINRKNTFFKAALNSSSSRGSFFFINDSSLESGNSEVFTSADLYLSESGKDYLSKQNKINMSSREFDNVKTIDTSNNGNVTNTQTTSPPMSGRFAYPKISISQNNTTRNNSMVIMSVNRYSYPSVV